MGKVISNTSRTKEMFNLIAKIYTRSLGSQIPTCAMQHDMIRQYGIFQKIRTQHAEDVLNVEDT